MRSFFRLLSLVLASAIVSQIIVACSGPRSPEGDIPTTQYNPATDRMGSLARIPPESDIPSGGLIPNLAPLVDAGKLAGANAEASTVKTAARSYYTDHPLATRMTSDELQPSYISGSTKARYQISIPTFSILRVDTVSGGWAGMVFSLSQQKWVKGTADGDHSSDQDIP